MTIDHLTIFIALIKITALLLIILSISLICARFRVKNKDIFILSIFASAVFLHQYVLCFPLMYLSYAVVILSGIIYILFCLYTRFKNKEQSHPLLKMIILTLLLLLPSFGGIRSYYLYKPLYLLNAKHLISNDAELPVLSYFTANPVKTKCGLWDRDRFAIHFAHYNNFWWSFGKGRYTRSEELQENRPVHYLFWDLSLWP